MTELLEEPNEQESSQEQIDAEIDQLAPLACIALKDSNVGDWDVKAKFKEEMQFSIVRHTWRCILGNAWTNGVCWGQNRVGKTTAIMRLMFSIYHDWDCVLRSIAFGLNSVVWKMDHKIPYGVLEQVDRIYWRVPILLSDDSGSIDNKAVTQSDESFNYLKGSIDLWGTRLANLWHSLNQPSELTSQLASKYTAELYIETRGVGKFDTCKWQPNYSGWIPNQKKKWKQSFMYDKIPPEIYKIYAVRRDEMIDQINQRYQDKKADTQIAKLLQRCQPIDFETLEAFNQKGSMSSYTLEKLDKDTVKRLLSRELLEGTQTLTKHYKYDISQLGIELLRAKEIADDPEKVKKELKAND